MLPLLCRLPARPIFSTGFIRVFSSQRRFSTVFQRKMEVASMTPDNITNGLPLITRSESPLSEVPDGSPEPQPEPKSKRRPRQRNAVVKMNVEAFEERNSNEQSIPKPKRQRSKRKATKEIVVEGEDNEGSDFEEAVKKKRTRRRRSVATANNGGGEDDEEKPKKKRRRKTPEEEKVFNIPPIEDVLSTSFKGRLGYACLNTMLRRYSTPIFCSRTCRLATIAELGSEHLRSLGLQNIRDLHTLVKWNAQNGIFFMRMSSDMFPFASHAELGYDLSFADEELKAIGKTARELGVRLTSHPGQFTQLGSPREVVVRNAMRDLEYHCEMMDRMGLDQDGVMIIHMGGTFNDKVATIERFKNNYTSLLSDSIKRRLVLENDELCYNVDDLLPLCRELHIPLVFDYHHDWIYPSSRPPRELIPEINQLWYDKGIKPKQHYSEPRPGAVSVMEKRAHSDRVKTLPEGLPDDMDLMLECKDKEQAVFYLYRLYNLREVDPRVLRPPAEVESLHTNGRKSNKRAKAKEKEKVATIESGEVGETQEDNDVDVVANVDGEDPKEVALELEREAEEHGLSIEASNDLATAALADGGAELDCGSGDEEPGVEVPPVRRRGSRKVKKQPISRLSKAIGGDGHGERVQEVRTKSKRKVKSA